MKLNRRTLLSGSLALGGLAAVGLTGCGPNRPGGGTSGPMAATFWGNPNIQESVQKSLAAVTAANPELTFEAQYSSYTDYWNKLAVRVSGGNPPDLLEMHSNFLSEYSSRGTLLDLSQYASELQIDQLSAAHKKAGTIDGKMWGIPVGTQSQVAIVDKNYCDALKIEPLGNDWTWETFASWVTEVAKAAGNGKFGTEDGGGLSYVFEVFARQRKLNLFAQDKPGLGFTVDDVAEFWTYWDKIRREGGAAPADVMAGLGAGLGQSLMLTGKAAIRFDYTNNYVNATTLTKNTLLENGYPGDNDPTTAGAYAMSPVMLSGSATSGKKDNVIKSIAAMLTLPASVEALGLSNGVPAYPGSQEALLKVATEAQKIAIERTNLVVAEFPEPPVGPPAGSSEILAEFGRNYQEVAYGRAKIPDAAKKFFDSATAKLGG